MAFGIRDVKLAPLRRKERRNFQCEYCGGAHSGLHEQCQGCGAPLMTLEAMEQQDDGFCYEYLTGDNTIISTYRYPCP